MADEDNHIDKTAFSIPFVCGCRNLGEALRRVAEGCAMLRTKGEAGTGNVAEALGMLARSIRRSGACKPWTEWNYSHMQRILGLPLVWFSKLQRKGNCRW